MRPACAPQPPARSIAARSTVVLECERMRRGPRQHQRRRENRERSQELLHVIHHLAFTIWLSPSGFHHLAFTIWLSPSGFHHLAFTIWLCPDREKKANQPTFRGGVFGRKLTTPPANADLHHRSLTDSEQPEQRPARPRIEFLPVEGAIVVSVGGLESLLNG